ncbi:DUF4363 family protein [Desulfallas sp. Bu1-1]|uniref:DUF4363 family protein n=1 Tax=Desulfallas sp. Bu1-1 TaxID=2787620 RepID=UPI0018A0D0B5|nr:DUF4363 family protein [Desulfallas sp. Bu1-1]MBF7083971.1 DUF4363 family protein [Desulfallas sp. Bu1-1]
MKIYLGVLAALVLVLAIGFTSVSQLEKTAGQMVVGFDRLDRAIAVGNWDVAREGVDKARNIWSRHKKWWAVVIDHQEIDNIDMAFARITKYIGMQDRAMASGELAVLRQMLEHIPEKERVSLQNIF